MAELIVSRLTKVGCKTALRILERAVSMSYRASKENSEKDPSSFLLSSLSGILDDYVRDKEAAERIVCNI
jgi:predicted component of type VI protein secretion system